MRRVLVAVACMVIAAGGAYAAIEHGAPTTAQLEADIAEVDLLVAEATSERDRFGRGSVLWAMGEFRRSVLLDTRSMLDQKRRSWLRGIDMVYQVEGKPNRAASAEEMAAIDSEIAQAEKLYEESRMQAIGSGGLVGAMRQLEASTNAVTLATLRQRRALAKYGIAVPVFNKDGSSVTAAPEEPKPPVGAVVKDKEAL